MSLIVHTVQHRKSLRRAQKSSGIIDHENSTIFRRQLMKGKGFGLSLLLSIFLGGCSDTVTNHYQTYDDAVKDQLFDRGWLPKFIPSSSFNITTSNNLDLNTSEGAFYFPVGAAEAFTAKLLPYSGREFPNVDNEKVVNKRKAEGYTPYEFTEDGYVWVFFLNRAGHVYYSLWPVKSGG
jgi:hypothetical protein